jgi:hypothetical protein
MAATSLSEVPGEPGWVLFEKRCWKTARERFVKNISGSDVKQAKVFLARQGSVDDAKSACQKVERDSSERYSTEKSFSISIAHKKSRPEVAFGQIDGEPRYIYQGWRRSICRRPRNGESPFFNLKLCVALIMLLGRRRMGRREICAQSSQVRLRGLPATHKLLCRHSRYIYLLQAVCQTIWRQCPYRRAS